MIPAVISGAIFAATLYLIFSEKLNRTIAAIAGSVLMVGAGLAFGFYTEQQAFASVDFNTLGLLFGMMVLVALLEPTGFFEFLALWAGRLSRGKPVRLFILLGTVTTLLSMFLDNVTTVVLIAPVTILITEVLGVNPVPLLVAEALLSNTGGVATLVGDPPNVVIGSAAGLSFNDFLTHSLPIVVVAWLASLALLLYLFREDLAQVPEGVEALLQMDPKEAMHDRVLIRRVLIVLGGAILLFFFHTRMHVSPSFIALGAAAIALVWTRPDIHKTFMRVEWGVLIFFTALFVMVGGLEASGVLHGLALLLERFHDVPDVVFGVILIWVVALSSAVVDNVPITIALIPIIAELDVAGIDATPLWWALAFGAGFGGNGTIIGSTANIVVTTLSERTRTPITPQLWNKRGLPVMLLTCTIASILYALAFPFLSR